MTTPAAPSAIKNPIEGHLGYQLRRASTVLMAVLAQKLATLQLTVTEASVLILIDRNPGITQSEIGRVLAIKRANMVPLTAMIERSGFVMREAAAGRSVALVTTPAGAKAAQMAERVMEENDQALFGPVSAENRKLFARIIDPVWREDERCPGGGPGPID